MASPMAMQLSIATILAVSAQILVGALIYSAISLVLAHRGIRRRGSWRRWRVVWTRSARALWRAAPYAASLCVLGWALQRFVVGGSPVIWADPWWFVALGAVPTAGCYLMLHAGRLEAKGRLRAARRQVRLGGQLAFAGSLLLTVRVWTDLIFRVSLRKAFVVDSGTTGMVLIGAIVAIGCGAFVAILAGLSGKPRPSGQVAALLYLGGLVGFIAAAQLAFAT